MIKALAKKMNERRKAREAMKRYNEIAAIQDSRIREDVMARLH